MIPGAPYKESKKPTKLNRKIKRRMLRGVNKKRNYGAQPRYTNEAFKFPKLLKQEMTDAQKRAKNKAKALRCFLRSFA